MRLALIKSPLPGLRHTLAHRVGAVLDHSHSNVVFHNHMSGSAWAEAWRYGPYN